MFEKAYKNNPERMSWKAKLDEMMKQPSITHHGRIGQDKMEKIRKKMDIWFYPTYFKETNCIGALECARDGVIPAVMHLAGLRDTVKTGIMVEGDIYQPETRQKFIDEVVKLSKDKKRIKEEIKKGKEHVKAFSWELMAAKWIKEFE